MSLLADLSLRTLSCRLSTALGFLRSAHLHFPVSLLTLFSILSASANSLCAMKAPKAGAAVERRCDGQCSCGHVCQVRCSLQGTRLRIALGFCTMVLLSWKEKLMLREQAKIFIVFFQKFHSWLTKSLRFWFCHGERRAGQPGLVKMWKDERGYPRLMFEKEVDQAHICIVGLKDSIVTICEPHRILVEEVTHDEWIKEFDSPLHASSSGCKESFDRLIQRLAESEGLFTEPSDLGLSGSSNLEDRSNPRGGSSNGARHANNNVSDPVHSNGARHANNNVSNPVHDDRRDPVHDDRRDPVHDDKEVKKVEVLLRIKGKPGHNIYPHRSLMCEAESCCAIGSVLTLKFTQKPNEDEKVLDVAIDTSFELSDVVVKNNGPTVGILHNDLMCSYHSKGRHLILAKSTPNPSTIDVSTKSTSFSSTGCVLGGELGLPAATATAKISGAMNQTRGKGTETSTSMRMNSISGTMYAVKPYSSPDLGENALSYIARHPVPLKRVKFEDSGLLDEIRKVPCMSMGQPMSLKCDGHFWVFYNSIERHTFEASRSLCQFLQVEPPKKWPWQTKRGWERLIAKQELKRDLLVNHGFFWNLYNGKVFRCSLGSTHQFDDPKMNPDIRFLMTFS